MEITLRPVTGGGTWRDRPCARFPAGWQADPGRAAHAGWPGPRACWAAMGTATRAGTIWHGFAPRRAGADAGAGPDGRDPRAAPVVTWPINLTLHLTIPAVRQPVVAPPAGAPSPATPAPSVRGAAPEAPPALATVLRQVLPPRCRWSKRAWSGSTGPRSDGHAERNMVTRLLPAHAPGKPRATGRLVFRRPASARVPNRPTAAPPPKPPRRSLPGGHAAGAALLGRRRRPARPADGGHRAADRPGDANDGRPRDRRPRAAG